MKKRIISMLLAGMMVLNSAVVYADADITGDYTISADTFDSEDEVAVQSESAEENASADDNANIGVNETSVAENNADVAFTDGDSDEVDITEENPEAVSSQMKMRKYNLQKKQMIFFQKMKWQFRTLEQPQPVAHLLQV